MLRLVPTNDHTEMLDDMRAYFAELGVSEADPQALIDEFFRDPLVHAYRIKTDVPVGFVFIEDYPDFTQVCEFCILPPHRRCGFGTHAARLTFDLKPGRWELSAMPLGLAFWRHVLPKLPQIRDLTEGPPHLPHQSAHFRFVSGATP